MSELASSFSSPSAPVSAKTTSIPWPSRTLVSAKTFRTSSSTIRIFFPGRTALPSWSCSSVRRLSAGSRFSTRWRKSAVSSSSRSGERTSLTTIASA